MKAAVLVFPGSNCDRDLAVAFRQAGFDVEPFAAASIAQVHKARLKGTGEAVAVKVLHPHVARRPEARVHLFGEAKETETGDAAAAADF